jgi:hypothetical protein
MLPLERFLSSWGEVVEGADSRHLQQHETGLAPDPQLGAPYVNPLAALGGVIEQAHAPLAVALNRLGWPASRGAVIMFWSQTPSQFTGQRASKGRRK